MRTFVDWCLGIGFVCALLAVDAWMDENKQKIEQARLSGVTEGAKTVAMKCGTVAGYINTGAKK
jgi:hypothetical protein